MNSNSIVFFEFEFKKIYLSSSPKTIKFKRVRVQVRSPDAHIINIDEVKKGAKDGTLGNTYFMAVIEEVQLIKRTTAQMAEWYGASVS